MTMKVTESYNNNMFSYSAEYKTTPKTENPRTQKQKDELAWMKKSNTENMAQYLNKMQRKFSYMTLCADRKMTMHQGSRTLTVHPDLLRKMQQDPVKEAEYTQHLKSIENLCKWIDGLHKVRGYTAKFHHWYVDENGKSCHFAQYVRTDKTSEKLRAARQKNAQALITRTRKNSAQKQKNLQASLQKKKAEKTGKAKKKNAGVYLDLRV